MTTPSLKRQLGAVTVAAVVAGNMLGSGIFFTPGELAAVAQHTWQVYFIWILCGLITLCGALTLAELSSDFPDSGSTFHIIRAGFGPFWGFLKIWMEMWVNGPGSVAGVAIVFGQFLSKLLGASVSPALWAVAAILFFMVINLLGIRWGGGTQVVLTVTKITALLALVFGSLLFASPAIAPPSIPDPQNGLIAFLRVVGLGVAAVLFTYDGWIDITHAAGEVKNPQRNLPLGLIGGVCGILILYVLVNYSYLRVVPLSEMKQSSTLAAAVVAQRTLGDSGQKLLSGLMMISIFGALGGLIMTLPRLFFAGASQYLGAGSNFFFRGLSTVSKRTAVPYGAILFSSALSILALLFFQSFSRLVNFFVVPVQFCGILMVASIYRLRDKAGPKTGYRTPGYPVVPAIFVLVMALFLLSAIVYNPKDTLIGIGLTATGVPVYLWMRTRKIEERG
jgi:amino acid transporter